MYEMKDFATRANHAARDMNYRPNAHQLPDFRAVTSEFDDVEEFEDAMHNGTSGVYARLPHHNPNHDTLEKQLTVMEGGKETLVFSSGMAAIASCLLATTPPLREILSSKTLYGCTYELLNRDMWPLYGRSARCVKIKSVADAMENLSNNTSTVYIEPVANPTLDVIDLRDFRKENLNNSIVIVDNTFATPYNLRPLEFGVDIVVHSLTKYINGMGDVLMGCATCSEDFTKTKHFQNLLRIYKNFGPIPSAHDSSLVSGRVTDFAARMEVHNANAFILANFLYKHSKIRMVYFPGLASGPDREVVRNQMRTPNGDFGFGGMLSFELHESSKTKDFMNIIAKETFIKLAVSLGSPQTIMCRPAKTTHGALTPEERSEMGIPEELIRVSPGRESYRDIIGAVEYGLSKI
ncbi:MAG: PLP-dependent transferase [Candidatus Liptonbacteria bacterium]|nr:PLP-dependent transferase [Candidatus Liptonbacteria bacterium]